MAELSLAKRIEKAIVTKNDPPPEKADAILCVGIDTTPDGQAASPQSIEIARKAARLYHLGLANTIICSGGYHVKGGVTEAKGMKNFLVLQNVPPKKIILEEESTRTYLNADKILPLIQDNNHQKVIIVAQQLHARRVRSTFRKRWESTGIEIIVVKAFSRYGGGSQKRLNSFWRFLLWDTLAYFLSWLKGWSYFPSY
ncbi:YdcF family protein [Patescibacteria group bacterium]